MLIILAGVLINLSLGNNGLFNKAKTAKEMYTNAQDYEEEQIAKISNEIEEQVNGNRDYNFNIEQISSAFYCEGNYEYTYNCTKKGKILVNLVACRGSNGTINSFYCKKNNIEINPTTEALDTQSDYGSIARRSSIYITDVEIGDVINISVDASGGYGDRGYILSFID